MNTSNLNPLLGQIINNQTKPVINTEYLNSKLELKMVKNLKFGNKSGYITVSGWVLYVEGYGYLSINDYHEELGFYYPYQPSGGKKVLQSILKSGLLSYDENSFVNPIRL